MKMRKARITGKVIKYLQELLSLMNLIARKKTLQDWGTGITTPIFKKGDSKVCSNFRGITLTRTVEKIYAIILKGKLCQSIEHDLEES